MQSHSPMLYWCSVYTEIGSSTSSYVCTATELYGTRNKFLPWKERSLWWNQGSKGSNARYIICVSFKQDNRFHRFLWYISGISVHVTWAGQTILTCSGTCTSKWRHVSNHVESSWGYEKGRKLLEEVFFCGSPCTLCRKHTRRNYFLQGSTHLPYKRLRTKKSLFHPQSSQSLETNFSLLQLCLSSPELTITGN